MNKPILLGTITALTAMAAMAGGKSNDPVLMTIGGKDVKLSEFEYLYNKNNSQQIQPQTLDEYVDMFVNYKLKVAAAEAAGIDTTASFLKEFNGYRDELAKPYLTDSTYIDSLARAAYNHYVESVDVSHLMVALTDQSGNPTPQLALIDSLQALVAAGEPLEPLARKYSIDRSVVGNGGHLGYITMGQFPYEFEEVAFATEPGKVSPVFDTRFGHHFIVAGDRKPNPGEVHVRHILLMTRGLDPQLAAEQKEKIDSIYTALKGGADFATAARTHSQDSGSAKNGGELPWFGIGRMVPQFEQVSYALADGEISEPFQSDFGWHIVQKLESREPASYETIKPDLLKMMERDVRATRIARHDIDRYEALYPISGLDAKANSDAKALLASDGFTPGTRVLLASDESTAATAGKEGRVTVADVIAAMGSFDIQPDEAAAAYDAALSRLAEAAVMDQAARNLASTNAAYRNLINEYRDGMLLFEISNREVWDRAGKDVEGMQRYFEANRDNYTWQKPHYKGYVVMCVNDSVAALARQFVDGRSFESADSLSAALKSRFDRDVRAEYVVTAQGDNDIVDYVAFGAQRPEVKKGRKMNEWFAYEGRVIDAPEEATDVKGAVSTDYQQKLEQDWVAALRKQYNVKIYNKVLKKVK